MNNFDYKNMTPFKWFVLENFPFIENDFEEINNYRLFSKVVEYLNKTIDNVNVLGNLVEQFSDYFDNLDVQEEINNKLDEMSTDGTLTNLIKNYINPIQENFENEINNTIKNQNENIENIQNQVNIIANGSPLVASSISEMTDTSKVYVNTSNGYWYIYDGSNWVQGGKYQSDGISNNSIDILMLNDNLRDNFSITYGEEISLGNDLQGLLSNTNNVLNINTSSTDYLYNIINLERGKIYLINAYNNYAMNGFYIVDNSNNILFDSNGMSSTNPTSYKTFQYIYRCTDNNQKIYFNKVSNNVLTLVTPILRTITNISNKLKVDNSITKLKTYENGYVYFSSNNDVVRFVNYSGVNCDMYSIEKGKKYHFIGKNYSGIHGLVVTDFQFLATYKSNPTGHTGDVDYEWTATENGFAYCATHDNYQLICLNDVMENINVGNIEKIGFNNWYAIGDSITEVNFRSLHNYLYWINQDMPELNIINKGVSGTGYKNGDETFIERLDNITSYDINNTIITVMGSINDIQYVQNSLGQLGDTTTDTLYGAMYTFFNTLFNKFNGVRIGCISPINWKNSGNSNALNLYCTALKDTCNLFNVPYLDMTHNTNLRPDNTNFLNTYYLADGVGNNGQIDVDGVHPNSLGHKLFYSRIKEFINKL